MKLLDQCPYDDLEVKANNYESRELHLERPCNHGCLVMRFNFAEKGCEPSSLGAIHELCILSTIKYNALDIWRVKRLSSVLLLNLN